VIGSAALALQAGFINAVTFSGNFPIGNRSVSEMDNKEKNAHYHLFFYQVLHMSLEYQQDSRLELYGMIG
jgi:hypothetical protein